MTLQPIWITDDAPAHAFPDVDNAMIQPNGLLAVGGDLSPPRLLHAYHRGIFPWFSQGQPILWWAPDPRAGGYRAPTGPGPSAGGAPGCSNPGPGRGGDRPAHPPIAANEHNPKA